MRDKSNTLAVETLKSANRALEEQKSLLQVALDHTKHGIVMFDRDNRMIATNARYLNIYGFSPAVVRPGISIDEIIRYSISLGNYSGPEAERVLTERKVQIDSPSPSTYQQRMVDGRTIAVNHMPIGSGGSVTTCEDITDVLLNEKKTAEIARSAALADAVTSAKSKFLSNMSHELRTPLNALMGFSEAMRLEMFGPLGCETYAEYATHMYESARDILSIVDRVLEVARIEAGNLRLAEATFAAAELLEGVVAAYEEKAREKNLVLRAGRCVDDVRLRADREMLRQALENIVDNAVKFSLPGGIVVISQKINANGDWVATVSNTGKGLDVDSLAEIMSPFGQQESAFCRENHGAGLGLPIALGLVRLHGGDISIESGTDVGTSVSVRLPAGRVSATPAGGAGAQSHHAPAAADTRFDATATLAAARTSRSA